MEQFTTAELKDIFERRFEADNNSIIAKFKTIEEKLDYLLDKLKEENEQQDG